MERITGTIDGMDHQVQHFERARFEAHPENAAPYNVLLGQFGRSICARTGNQVVALCSTGTLRTDLLMMARAGGRDGNIHLINTSNVSCSLNGALQVELLDQYGAPLPVTITGPQGVTRTVAIAVAGRGQMISVPVCWTNYCGTDPGRVSKRLTLPDGGQVRVTNSVSVPPCLGETQPPTPLMRALRVARKEKWSRISCRATYPWLLRPRPYAPCSVFSMVVVIAVILRPN